MTHSESAALLCGFVVRQPYARLAGAHRRPRGGVANRAGRRQLVGVALLRYVLRVEPIASVPTDQLVAWITPMLDGYLSVPTGTVHVRSVPFPLARRDLTRLAELGPDELEDCRSAGAERLPHGGT